jgi:hypothetical protein
MLQRIEQLMIEDVRIWKGHHVFDFHSGVTVLYGDNGQGKSTLGTMLMLTLTHSANSDKLKKQLLPTSGGSPKSSVTFTTKEGRFTITKIWGDRDQSKLVNADSGDVLANGGDAEDQVRQMAFEMPSFSGNYTTGIGPIGNLLKSSAEHLASLTFHSQGMLHEAPEMGENLRRIGLTVDDAELAKALLSVAQGAEKERANFIKTLNKTGQPTKSASGSFVDAKNNLIAAKIDHEAALALEIELNDATAALFESHERGEGEISEESREDTRTEIKTLRAQAEKYSEQREDAQKVFENCREKFTPAETLWNERKKIQSESSEAGERHDDLQEKSKIAKKTLAGVDEQLQEAEDIFKGHKDELILSKAWQLHLRREQDLSVDTQALNDFNSQLTTRDAKETAKGQLIIEREKLTLASKEDWEALREIDGNIIAAKVSRKMTIIPHEGLSNLQIFGDGELVKGEGEAAEVVEIRDGELVLIEIQQSMVGDSPSELERQKMDLLRGLGAETSADLHQRQSKNIELETKIQGIEAVLEAIPSKEELKGKANALQSRLEKEVKEPSGTCPEGDLNDVIIRVEERKILASATLEGLRAKRIDAHGVHSAAFALWQEAQAKSFTQAVKLNEHRTIHGNDETLQTHYDEAKNAINESKTIHDDFLANRELRENTPLQRAKRLENNLDEYDNRRASLLQLEERIKLLRKNSLLRELPSIDANISKMEGELERLRFDHDAYQHLVQIAEEQQVMAQAQSRSEITMLMNRFLSYVWNGDAGVQLDEEGKPVAAGQINIDDESHGTKEQLQTVLRMVLLSTASDELGTTMLLDDALVFADPGRLSRMKDVIQQFVTKESMQFIIFSCKEGDYLDIADKDFNINDRT